jgi:hypothetical protein
MNAPRLVSQLTVFCALCATSTAFAEAAEKRVVTFRDGRSPKLEVQGSRFVRGAVDVELRLEGTNPFCYRYTTNVRSGQAVGGAGAPLPALPSLREASAAPPAAGVEEAAKALTTTSEALERTLRDARQAASFSDLWAACAAGGNFAAQQTRLASASQALASGLGSGGSWRQSLLDANAAIDAALAAARASESDRVNDADLEAKRTAVADATKRVEEATARIDAAKKAVRKVTKEEDEALERAQAELERARTALTELERRRDQATGARDLAERAAKLSDRKDETVRALQGLIAEVGRAQALLGRSPLVFRAHYAAGTRAQIEVTRTPLVEGKVDPNAAPETFNAPTIHAENPIFLDVGVGPALTIGKNSQDYDLVVHGNPGRLVVARTEQELIVDGMVSFSAYLWGDRYLDNRVFDVTQLIPRPMFGVSMRDPFSSIYVGGQIDPVQFIDFSGGVRFTTTKAFIGQKFDPEHPNLPGEPATREKVTPLGFAAITFSTDLFWRWIKHELD